MYDWQPSYVVFLNGVFILAEILLFQSVLDCSAIVHYNANIMIYGQTELTPYPYAMHDIAMYDIAMYDITSRNSLHQQHSASSQAEKWGHGEKAPSSL